MARWFLIILLTVLVGGLWTAPARAATPLTPCIARQAPGVTLARVVAGAVALDCDSRQHRFGAGSYWVVAEVPAASSGGTYASVRSRSLWQRGLTLHVVYADGKVATVATTSATLSRYLQLGTAIALPLPQHDAAIRMLVWRIDDAANIRGLLLGPEITRHAEGHLRNVGLAALYGGFGGLALALFVYHLALWAAVRHRFQLAYCAMVAALAVYAFSSSGALAWAWPAIDNNDRIRLNYVSLGLAGAAAVVFARTFFEDRVFAGWLAWATTAAIAMLATSGVLFAILSEWDVVLADALYVAMTLGGLAIVLPILWRAASLRSNYLGLFAAAWAAPILFAFARLLAALHALPNATWLDSSTVFSMALEALISSIAIAYRMRIISRERDAARESEVVARALADTDPLTGLLNRRSFLAHAVGGETRTLHVIDIDHFKQVNETIGHDGGDDVLCLVARTLRDVAPEGALVARIGGEEFAILAPEHATLEAEAILMALRRIPMPYDLPVTASVGSCSGPLTTDLDWKRLYRAADRALFVAKADGRDRARSAPPLACAA